MFADREIVNRLTGRVRFRAQRRVLDAMGIRYTLAATGEPLILASALAGAPDPAQYAVNVTALRARRGTTKAA